MGWVVSVTPRPRFTPRERTPGTHCTRGWVGPRAGLDTEVRGKILSPLPSTEPRSSGHPVRSQDIILTELPGSRNWKEPREICQESCPRSVCLSRGYIHWPKRPTSLFIYRPIFMSTWFVCAFKIKFNIILSTPVSPKRRLRVVNIPASYSGGPGFKSRPRDRLSWVLSWFSSVPGKWRDSTLKSGHDRFLPHPF
jgi:hypothetical protein